MNVDITELTQSKSGIFNVSQKFGAARANGKLGFTMSSLLQNFLPKTTHPSVTVTVLQFLES